MSVASFYDYYYYYYYYYNWKQHPIVQRAKDPLEDPLNVGERP
jgi:hypothetical protein